MPTEVEWIIQRKATDATSGSLRSADLTSRSLREADVTNASFQTIPPRGFPESRLPPPRAIIAFQLSLAFRNAPPDCQEVLP